MSGGSKLGIARRRGATNKQPCNLLTALVSVVMLAMLALFIVYAKFLSPHRLRQGQAHRRYSFGNNAPETPMKLRYQKTNHNRNKETNAIGVGEDDIWDPILRAELHLVEISVQQTSLVPKRNSNDENPGYSGVSASFCRLNWDLHKNDPPSVPMFKFLLEKSECGSGRRKKWITVDLGTAVKKARAYDELMQVRAMTEDASKIDGYVHSIPPSGFVFHESRVGSTLVANILAGMDPAGHRVYSEATPSIVSLRACMNKSSSDCDMGANIQLFRDVVYLMGRTNSLTEQRLFFKSQSIGTKAIHLFSKAFPSVPWVFVYRDPVQTMMSHMDPDKDRRAQNNAVCLRSKKNPPADLKQLVTRNGRVIGSLSNEEFCAAHLASLCESALQEMRRSSTGRSLNYDNLVENLIQSVIPNHFGIEVDDKARQRILNISKIYSKSRVKGGKDWVEDSERKESRASRKIQEASETFLSKSFAELKQYSMQ